MTKLWVYIGTVISAIFSHDVVTLAALPMGASGASLEPESISVSVPNIGVSQLLAGHRSHSSHRSHRSHRSSAGGRFRTPSTPRQPPTSLPKPSPQKPVQPKSDPLGQEPRSPESFPSQKSKSLSEKLKDKKLRKNIIMRMQLTLKFEGYYNGQIDGVMGPKTRKAVLEFKKDMGIPGDKVLDARTLNGFGIVGF